MSAGRNLNDNEYELLSAYLDGRLTDTERRELE
ncbi:MAG: zf-HC2 domain-containing protein, partial [Burkholderiales bacterium]|nr:zf-HC2 domain-containing protein [Anaerolineae bacterium]